MRSVWKTKYGPRRVRYDPPTLSEAIIAAQGLTENVRQQAEIAASLMELTVEDVMTDVLKARQPQRNAINTVAFTNRKGIQRAAIVERKTARRPYEVRRFGY